MIDPEKLFPMLFWFFVSLILIAILVPVIGCMTGGIYKNYSDGTRTGVVVKLSHKGLFFKSWEGNMNVGSASINGQGMMVPVIWEFSVQSDSIDTDLQKAVNNGQSVTLHYHQYLVGPIQLSTDYVIDAVILQSPKSEPVEQKENPAP